MSTLAGLVRPMPITRRSKVVPVDQRRQMGRAQIAGCACVDLHRVGDQAELRVCLVWTSLENWNNSNERLKIAHTFGRL